MLLQRVKLRLDIVAERALGKQRLLYLVDPVLMLGNLSSALRHSNERRGEGRRGPESVSLT